MPISNRARSLCRRFVLYRAISSSCGSRLVRSTLRSSLIGIASFTGRLPSENAGNSLLCSGWMKE
ncbi:hypothetical protein D3C81_2008800 [compost metagenome]